MIIWLNFKDRRKPYIEYGVIIPIWKVWEWIGFAIKHVADPIKFIRIRRFH